MSRIFFLEQQTSLATLPRTQRRIALENTKYFWELQIIDFSMAEFISQLILKRFYINFHAKLSSIEPHTQKLRANIKLDMSFPRAATMRKVLLMTAAKNSFGNHDLL